MARMRTLKPEAATSESLAQVPRELRWTFAMLWTYLDDEGRGVRNARLIKAAIYPLDDDVTPGQIIDELDTLASIGALCFYEISGKLFVHVPAWHDHQHPNRKVPSKLPPCPKSDHSDTTHAQRSEDALPTQPQDTAVVVVGVVDGVVVAPERATAPKRGTRLDPEWKPPPTEVAWRRDNDISDFLAKREHPKFVNYWVAKSGRDAVKLDWLLTWRNWLLTAREREPEGRAAQQVSTRRHDPLGSAR